MWEMIGYCWHQDPAQRPNMTEVIGLLSELLMSSLSMEGDLRDFFKVCETQGRDGLGEKAREFADELDEVCYAERLNTNPSHHKSRHLTTRVFSRKNGRNIYGTCKNYVAPLTFFHPRFYSRKNPSNENLSPLTRVATRVCSKQPSRSALS